MSRDPPAIVLIGATGYTGGLIAHELGEGDQPFVLAARDPDRLRTLAERVGAGTPQVVDVTDPASLRRLIRSGDALINTAGPFTELGEPVVAACIDAGAHYLDTTGEQPWMRTIHDRYDAAARAADVTVVNAMAFEYALGDCALAVAAAELTKPLRTVDVVYAWGGTASSRGTRRTVVRMLGRRGWERVDGELVRRPPGAERRRVRLTSGTELEAVTFGSGEVVTAPRWVEVDTVRGWLVMGALTARIVPLLAPALPFLVPPLRPLLERTVTRPGDPTPEEREASEFTIRIEVEDGDGERRALDVRGRDPYGITAAAAVRGARRALAPDSPSGVLAPSELVDPGRFLSSLSPFGVEVVRDTTPS